MIVACHQPLYLPWPGLFYKALRADTLALLDHVPFPMGRSWISRNRLKNADGAFWLTVPVKRKGRHNAPINSIEIYQDLNWERKHLESIRQAYANAPYLDDHLPFFRELFKKPWRKIVDLNLAAFDYLKTALGITTPVVLSSGLNTSGRGADLLVDICRILGADVYLTLGAAKKYLDLTRFEEASIGLEVFSLQPPVYPQLYGEFVANLSAIDTLLCCGPKTAEIVSNSGRLAS